MSLKEMVLMLERRHHRGDCEIRTGPSGKKMIAGYAAVFGKRSLDLGGFVEDIHPGAFERTLRTADVRALANHDANQILGRSKSGTLRLGTDSGGLHYEVDMNEADPMAQGALARVERGDWDGSSFSFRAVQDSWEYGTDPAQRTLREVELYDVGPVTFPAYPDATSNARAAVELLALRESRSVDEVAAALESGSLRSLLEQAVPLPEAAELPVLPDPAEPTVTVRRGEVEQEIERERIYLRQHGVLTKPKPEPPVDPPDAARADPFDSIIDHGWIRSGLAAELVSLRAGKTLSAASIARIQAAIETLEDMIAQATGTTPDANSVPTRAEERAGSQQALLTQMDLAAQQFVTGCGADTSCAIAMQEIITALDALYEDLTGTDAVDETQTST